MIVKELNKIRGVEDRRTYQDSPVIQEAARQQDLIGWQVALYSLYSTKWEDAQEEWIQRKNMKWKRSPKKWADKLVEASLEVAWKMWENRNKYLHDDLHPWQRKGENSTNIMI